jgi:aminoglycoside phosphotransferase (APT) family kinase protein
MEPLDVIRLTAEVGRVIGEPVDLVGATTRGESRSTYFLRGQSGEVVLKVSPAGTAASANQERLLRLVNGLRARGYPAPEYLGVGRVDEVVFTVQRRLPGQSLEPGPGMAPGPELLQAVLGDLLPAIELQRDAGDLSDPPWPTWLIATIERGGEGYCLHETMRQRGDTSRLLDRLQRVAERNWSSPPRRSDLVHFDMSPANVLHHGGRLSGVVDWTVPFTGAAQGDRGFDAATLLFYTYDVPATREALWELAWEISGVGWIAVYLCHLGLRQVEWTRRHNPASAEERRFLAIANRVLDDCEARGA